MLIHVSSYTTFVNSQNYDLNLIDFVLNIKTPDPTVIRSPIYLVMRNYIV